MKRLFCLAGLLLFVCCPPGLFAQTVRSIEIRHVGPPAASDDLIRANIRVQEGDAYTRTGADDDVRTLYATGLFYNIRVVEEHTPEGINLVYLVQGRPTLTEIRFEGNQRFSDRRLLRRISSKVGEPLDDRKLSLDANEILKLYQGAGRHDTEVEPVISIDEATGRGSVVFEITETPKVRIEQIEFIGNEAFSDRRLRRVIRTRRHWLFSWITGGGVLKEDEFQEDKQRLAGFYHNEGYIDFQIRDVTIHYPEPRRMIIQFHLFEGAQYRVGAVSLIGNTLFTDQEIMAGDQTAPGLRMTTGETYTPLGLAADLKAIQDYYGARGYIDVFVRPIRIPNIEQGAMDLVYEVIGEERGVSFVERIDIRGNVKTKDRVIRRELAISPGEVFDMVRVQISQSRLEQMGYFEKVETDAEPTDIPNRRNLVIDVEEAATGHLEFGAGFSSVDHLIGFVGYREGNFDLFNPPYFRGGGQKLRIFTQLGTRRQDYQISFVEPWFLGRKLAFSTDLYHRDLRFFSDIYDIRQTGARLALTRALWSDFLIGSVSYTIENIGLRNVHQELAPLVIRQEPSNRLVTKFGTSLAYDTRNHVQLPDQGQRTEFLTEVAGPFGGDTDFYKLELRSAWYFPGFFEGHIWELRGRAGVVEEWGRSDRVPLFDRYFLGGVTSMRGFRYRRVGPHQEGEPIGGQTYWFGSAEYSIPIIERLRFAVFYDIGNVYLNAYSFSLVEGQKEFNDNWGVGLRLNIPRLGPLRFDYGVPINHDRFTSGSGRFQFSVSYSADF